jgi:hypothetical protein
MTSYADRCIIEPSYKLSMKEPTASALAVRPWRFWRRILEGCAKPVQRGDHFAFAVVQKAENERVGMHGFNVKSGKRGLRKIVQIGGDDDPLPPTVTTSSLRPTARRGAVLCFATPPSG